MIKDATKQIIKRTLQSSFDKGQFLNFTKNLLNHIDETKARHFRSYVKHQFKKTTGIVKTYERLATYTDPNDKKIDVLVVYLEKDNSIDRARTTLRNFVADYLKQRDQKDAALVAFVSPSQDDWRFSLIKMDYKFEKGTSGKIKVKEEFTPARRWSFLVGAKESSHTAQSRLAPILEDDENKPTLEQLEDAFSIEKVTKEFFEKYRELFLGLKDNLDEMVKKDVKIKADFAEKDVGTVDFAKKLLGQIVFLYFLQKKGWFGVERDANWGTGPKDFLRQLYEKKHCNYKNFFNEILEPMFYEALARERDDDYYGRFNCKIPFLNGGLFDPIGNYDWVHTDINLDNELFSNTRPTKQGDIGDGILDIFDRYNFTVREDEPLEKEVAVDPEMLGKVFENLLEVKDRKSKGTYYTPREIVHYMCEQSLINYLAAELNSSSDGGRPVPSAVEGMDSSEVELVPKSDIEIFIKTGNQVLESEILAVEKGKKSKLPQTITENAKLIDQKLAEIKVCDPAIGSGAFPVGMMSEIVNARLSLNPFLCRPVIASEAKQSIDPESSSSVVANDSSSESLAKLEARLSHHSHSEQSEESLSLECAGRTAYDFKMQAITNSIYGVDIDPGAVEIAKLRLWLSLVVDENDIKQIKPLPNLDYKIMQGNSLLEEFEGIKLFDESIIPQDHADREAQIVKANEKINKLQREFFRLHSKNELSKSQEQLIKQQIKSQQKLIQSLQEKPKQGGTVDLFNQIDEIKAKWDELTELHKKIISETNRQEKRKMLDRASELEWQFIEASLKSQISPPARGGARGGGRYLAKTLKKIRDYKKKNTKPFFLWHLHFADVFQSKGGFDVVIANPPYINTNDLKKESEVYRKLYSTAYGSYDIYVLFFEKSIRLLRRNGVLSFITSIKYFIADYAKKLRALLKQLTILSLIDLADCKQIFENAFVSPAVTIVQNIENNNYSIKVSLLKDNDVSVINSIPGKLISANQISNADDGSFNIYIDSATQRILNKISLDTFDLGNTDFFDVRTGIMGFEYWNMSSFISEGASGNSSIRVITNSHLDKYAFLFDKKINLYKKNFNNPFLDLTKAPINQNTKDFFMKKKIIIRGVARQLTAQIDTKGYAILVAVHAVFINNNLFDEKYILALLNSSLFNWLHLVKFYTARIPMGSLKYPVSFLKKLPVKNISQSEQKPFIGIVDKILNITKSGDYLSNLTKQSKVHEYERQIDQMVYRLYELTENEIAIVEKSSNEQR